MKLVGFIVLLAMVARLKSFRTFRLLVQSRRLYNSEYSAIMKATVIGQSSIESSAERIVLGSSSLRILYQVDDRIHLLQKTDGKALRSHIPSLLIVDGVQRGVDNPLNNEVESAMQFYLDAGGRVSRLQVSHPPALSPALIEMGFTPTKDTAADPSFSPVLSDGYMISRCEDLLFLDYCKRRVVEIPQTTDDTELKHRLYDVIGRLTHASGNPSEAINYYTLALQAKPASAAAFRNLGSAYHATGNMQMTFASYQQAIQLDAEDVLVYLKLAFFYEEFATKDWVDAASHAQKCYEFYLASMDPTDTSVLTRLGNLLLREHMYEQAIAAYDRAVAADPMLYNVWFNRAQAMMKIDNIPGAVQSLRKTLELQPSVVAARHMLNALSDDDEAKTASPDPEYVIQLFKDYAKTYDDHGKKLIYAAPRVIRQELAKIYKSRLPKFDDATEVAIVTASEKSSPQPPREEKALQPPMPFAEADHPVGSSCQTYKSNIMDDALDILDLGCGTGQVGAWLKDYARSLVGVDISADMISVARSKMLYNDLKVSPLDEYLTDAAVVLEENFDVVVAAEVFSYIGDLFSILHKAARTLKPGGHLVFTLESIPEEEFTSKGYKLLKNGRFGFKRSYLNGLIASLGKENFSVVMDRDFSPRLDAGNPTPGYLYILEKTKK